MAAESSLGSDEHPPRSQSMNGCRSHETNGSSSSESRRSQDDSKETDEETNKSKTPVNVKTPSISYGLTPKAAERVGVEKKQKSFLGNERQFRDSSHCINGSCHHNNHHRHDDDNRKTEEFNNKESQKNVWNYLIQQQEQEKAARLRIHADDLTQFHDDHDDDEEEEALNDSGELEESDLQRQEQLSNFKAKLSAFENLAKSGKKSSCSRLQQENVSSSDASSSASSTSGHNPSLLRRDPIPGETRHSFFCLSITLPILSPFLLLDPSEHQRSLISLCSLSFCILTTFALFFLHLSKCDSTPNIFLSRTSDSRASSKSKCHASSRDRSQGIHE